MIQIGRRFFQIIKFRDVISEIFKFFYCGFFSKSFIRIIEFVGKESKYVLFIVMSNFTRGLRDVGVGVVLGQGVVWKVNEGFLSISLILYGLGKCLGYRFKWLVQYCVRNEFKIIFYWVIYFQKKQRSGIFLELFLVFWVFGVWVGMGGYFFEVERYFLGFVLGIGLERSWGCRKGYY